MSDNKSKTGTPDNDLVSLTQAYEVSNWCKRWKCTEVELRAAVKKVGNSVKALDRHFGR